MTDKEKLIERIESLLMRLLIENDATYQILGFTAQSNKMVVNGMAPAIAQAWLEDVEKAKLEAVTHIMSIKTEGIFDNGDLFIKRRPVEQAVVDVIGYEAYKALQKSLPKPFGEDK